MSLLAQTAVGIHYPGLPFLGSGIERYLVKGGGATVIDICQGDTLEIIDSEGLQTCEIAVLDDNGREASTALGVQARSVASGLEKVLSMQTASARKLHSKLASMLHGIPVLVLFEGDSRAGESVSFTAQRDVVCVISAPRSLMQPDQQLPPTDLTVLVKRLSPKSSTLEVVPEPMSDPRQDFRINKATAQSYEVRKGEYIQIIDVSGRQCSDFLVFAADKLEAGIEFEIDPATTRTLMGRSVPEPGLYSKFYDRDQRPMVELVQDTVGRHDTFNLACTSRYYEELGYAGHISCSGNFNYAIQPFGVAERVGWSSINFFYNTAVDDHNTIFFDEPWSRPGDYVLLQAQQDLVCLSSACPCDIDAANGWNPTDIHVRVYPGSNQFSRAKVQRKTPDAVAELTRETGFHTRTQPLCNDFTEYKGYWLPNHYAASGMVEEYWACREDVVAVDLSALRKFEITGPDAEILMQKTLTRNIRRLALGQVVYSAICYETGGMIDDGTLFRLGDENFRWICGSDYCGVWLREQAEKLGLNVWVKSSTDQLHNISVQGPKSRDVLKDIIWTRADQPSIEDLGWFRFTIGRLGHHNGPIVVVSRTGYTGELGYECWCHPNDCAELWDAVFEAGASAGIKPCGLEALDVLRIEAGLIFADYEFCDQTDPFEAGIGFSVTLASTDEDFVGRQALERRKEHPQRKLVGLEIQGNETAINGDPVHVGRSQVGEVTSAVRSPILKKNIALCRLSVEYCTPGTKLEIGKLDAHQKRLSAVVVPFPFYDPEKSRVRS